MLKEKTATITLNAKDYKWSDGQPFTIDDYIFAIEAIGNKDYTGSRYNDRYTNIVGMKDFHEGKSDKISGVEKVDDYTVKLHFEKNVTINAISRWCNSSIHNAKTHL